MKTCYFAQIPAYRTLPWDSLNDRWKCLCLVSWATASCVWT